jgi:signal transduction histidine kinase
VSLLASSSTSGPAVLAGAPTEVFHRKRRRLGLRIKFVVLVSIGLIISGIVFGWAFSRRYQTMLRSEFQKRGEMLARGLAAHGRLDVLAGNKERLTRLTESAREEPDVVAASVYDARREVLARAEKIPGAAAERLPAVPGAVAVEARTLPDGAPALSFVAPVESQREPGRAADESANAIGGPSAVAARTEASGAIEIVLSLGAVEQRIADVGAATAKIAAAIVVIGIVLVYWLSRVFLMPIERIAVRARRIAAGDFRLPATVRSGDELGELADALDTMATALAKREEELRLVNQSLEEMRERTSGLEIGRSQLIGANLELERSNQLKSESLANMAHELRTALNAVTGFSELLLEQRYGPLAEKQRRCVDNILASSKYLLQLINDILDLSKIEAGRMDLRFEEFSLRQAIEGAVNVIQPLAEKKGLGIDLKIEAGLDSVRLDAGKMKQVLHNLLSNAVKFTDAGAITISASRDAATAGWIELTVADTGIGIRRDDQTRIFREFERVDGSDSRKYEGTGLGLALTRRLVELQGGTIRLESEIGRGSRFIVRLPSTPEVRAQRNESAEADRNP